MKLTEVPAHMVTGGHAAAGTTNATLDDVRAIIAAAFTADENEPIPTGCACPIHTGEATVDWAALDAVPAELVDAFETGAHDAAHGQKPYSTEDVYIRGGLAAVLPAIATRFQEHLLMLANGYEELAHDGGMPGASKTGAGSPRGLRAEARMLRELANTSWITGGDQ